MRIIEKNVVVIVVLYLQINENGILSFRSTFRDTFIREFDSFFRFTPLIAPFWTDLDLNRFGGRILLRMTRDISTLERARNLTGEQFLDLDFAPTDVVIVTWFEVGHRFLGSRSNVCQQN